ncbi:hypothetical protein DZF91_19130 [Actinomadura logoneensis]|uniref:DUF7144 domain-containing protein n=1 Tax=Actinomadura logoneensis TaxID=2293572 RepID=A0A372JL31_9ACTN|nr:hypothetical protein [Actinomadura logoneensis]RFU40028.1 hypothetical protein DZF91_19130 [Actinomadura logoneensis]
MATTPRTPTSTSPTPHGVHSGWLGFAGVLGVLLGVFNVIDGLVALFNKDFFLTNSGRLLVFGFTAWGWIWLIVGLIQIAVGVGILAGQTWARAAGVVFAALAMIGHFTFLAAYPVWSVINILMAVLIIYGLISAPHGARG